VSLATFSERYGYTPVRDVVQRESLDLDLRTGLWNAIDIIFWTDRRGWSRNHPAAGKDIALLIWARHLKEPLDSIPYDWKTTIKELRNYFFDCQWYDVYNFVEFLAHVDDAASKPFVDICNRTLEREISAYRFVGGRITEITSEAEIAEIETALALPGNSLVGARTHLQSALGHLSDRTSPDYRNSIKESISAVESLANAVNGTANSTLGAALSKLEQGVSLHPALKGAFSKLYGYTSNAEGIRHALMEESDLRFEDAKFMLVSCSAFVNYLVAKAGKAGLSLS
jgi:hypothetical protein